MKNLLLLFIANLFLSNNLIGQEKKVFIESGWIESREILKGDIKNFTYPINPYSPISLGYTEKMGNHIFNAAYIYENIKLGANPRYLEYDIIGNVANRPNHSHSLAVDYGYSILNLKKSSITFFLGPQFRFLPYYRMDKNWNLNDSSYYVKESIFSSIDSSFLYKGLTNNKYVSPFSINVRTGIEFQFDLGKNFDLGIIPTYSFGLIDFIRNEYTYEDIKNNINGKIVMTTNGTYYGIRFRLSYKLSG